MAETIKEFLVALGFHVDENSLGKFNTTIGRTTARVAELGAEVVATATAIQVGISKMARDFEQLYYAGERTRSSVVALQSFEYAARTIGVSGDQARGAIEGLYAAMRGNPGVGALLNKLGVKTAGREGVDVLDDFVDRLSKMPYYIAQQYAAIAGIDGGVLYQLLQRHKELKAAEDDRKRRVREAGVDEQGLAAASHEYNNELRHLEDNLGILGEQIESKFLGPAKFVIHALDELVEGFVRVNKATEGWAGVLGTLVTTSLGVFLGKLLLMRTLFRGAAAEAAGAAAGASGTAGGGVAATGAAGVGAWLLRLLGPVGALLGMTDQAGESDAAERARRGAGGSGGSKIIDFFRSQGWTAQQAAGIATNLDSESGLNPGAVGDQGSAYGLGQWHSDRQEAFKRWSGHDIRGSSLEEQLNFVQYELTRGAEQFAGKMLARATSAGEAGAIVSRFYERPGNVEGEASARAGQAQNWYDAYLGDKNRAASSPTVKQNTTIHVTGSDPKTTADKVADAQSRVNGDIVRNIAAVTR